MSSIEYDEIFASFLGYIEDSKLASLDENEVDALFVEYLHKALAKSYIRKLFTTLSLDDDVRTISFSMNVPVSEQEDIDFVVDIVSNQMVVEWLKPIVYKTSLLKQMITSNKEAKFYSQSAHLAEMNNLMEQTKNNVRALILDRDYLHNEYLDGTDDL